jgi:hypothetical protein
MAKANNTSTTVVWIWLHDALVLATKALGSEVLAKERLRGWMARSQLPWDCMLFEGLDADAIARLREQAKGSIVGYIFPSAVYHKGDPAFWLADLNIWWNENENAAREKATGGARALGIRVPHERLLALLTEEAGNRVEKLVQTKPAGQKQPKAWFAEVRKNHPRQHNEDQTTYAGRLHALMRKANVTKVWSPGTLLRRLYDK